MEDEYYKLLKDIYGGVKVRSFVFGSNSEIVYDYIQRRKPEIYDLKNRAYDAGVRLGSEKSLKLSTKLLLLEVQYTENIFRNCR